MASSKRKARFTLHASPSPPARTNPPCHQLTAVTLAPCPSPLLGMHLQLRLLVNRPLFVFTGFNRSCLPKQPTALDKPT